MTIQPTTEADKPCIVVAIGASAGGQIALEQMFAAMPNDCGMSFLVIMHLRQEGPSFLVGMLSRYTTMEVLTAEEGMALRPDRVYVIPAGRNLIVKHGYLHLEIPEQGHGAHHPIDRLLHSLSEQSGERIVAVVLSGTGSDGAQGAKKIKGVGGIVITQEPGSAEYPGMPQSVIDTGAADLILPAEQIAVKIAEISRGYYTLPSHACHVASLDENLATVISLIKDKTGHDFSAYKTNTVMRRIERRMAMNDVTGIGKYIALLRENPQEAQALCQDILIGVTSFFRDPEAFAILRREVIPSLLANRAADEPVRIWHACCSTGEEVYSMAMLIKEYLSEHKLDTKVLIFATDIDELAIAQARAGLYDDNIEADVGEERLKIYFTRTNDHQWQVTKALREMVVFAQQSLIKDPPFSRLDLLVCRNFLIYLNPDMQKRLITLFHHALKPGGVLFLGNSETVGRSSDLFATIDKKWKIFERLKGECRSDISFPYLASVRRPFGTGRLPKPPETAEPSLGAVAEKILMERYSPPCVVVDEKYEIVHISNRTSDVLEDPIGEPTKNILRKAKEALRPALRAAIHKAFAEQEQIEFKGIMIVDSGGEKALNVIVEPLKMPLTAGKLAMVIFEPAVLPAMPPGADGVDSLLSGEKSSRDMLVRQLEEQLRITSDQLQATVEQLESSNEGYLSANEKLMSINEEFQSANEELQSTNEELETSKEELQALNEELATVNAELQDKVEELNQANSDMENLLTSSEIATLFLDRQLNIKGFTPAAAAIFNLIPADIRRPFRHFAGKIDWPTLVKDAETVLAGEPFAEREVTTLDSERCYLNRVFPYRTTQGKIDGIVITLVDITERKRADEASMLLAAIVESSDDAILSRDLNGIIRSWNPGAERLFGYSAEEVIGKSITQFIPPKLYAEEHRILQRVGAGKRIDSYEAVRVAKDGRKIDVSITISPIKDKAGKIIGASRIARDISERKRTETALRQSLQQNEFLAKVIETSSQPFAVGYPDGRLELINAAFEQLTGYTADELRSIDWITALTPPEWRDNERHHLEELQRTGQPLRYEKEYLRKDGSRVPIELLVHLAADAEGNPEYYYSFVTDITERKQVEQALKDADRRKDEFLAMLAHELRNPLAPIRNAVEIQKRAIMDPSRITWCTDILDRQINHLTGLVDDLLDISRISRGLVELKKETLEIREFIQPAVETNQLLIDSRRQEFSMTLPPEPVWVEGDRIRLAQVVSNLIHNAAKFTDEEGHIGLSVEASNSEVCIHVSDNGSGIDSANLSSLFDLFYQADRHLDRSQGGLGIGLSLVRSLVEKHGGDVRVFSAGRGQGSEFVIRLPRLILSKPATAFTTEPTVQIPKKLRILVVDDMQDIAESLALLLEIEGYLVQTANNGFTALEIARAERPDVILLDIGLPGMDGYSVAKALRQDHGLERTLLIALTGYGQSDDRKKSHAAGFDAHLVKPVNIEKLRELLDVDYTP